MVPSSGLARYGSLLTEGLYTVLLLGPSVVTGAEHPDLLGIPWRRVANGDCLCVYLKSRLPPFRLVGMKNQTATGAPNHKHTQ
ncbi:uncharacterized protein MYCFIDRAFT_174364 [Pseudocercospora fijiensis CIRAD86]|uniref:Uncharacterized protein n=1 Tax=Pseudocercospora fijiensis (strain CIRAD86) TaxID=383855 RepID=M2ZV14_PSEFD|nr:uncharacterized protein MYCFIDRAFT_174364 [Pseudocercospora fijiensis CIRAD86]EME82839.1 hypothetical protein MYCFIDRAFT_174364 [Pseudocercospora fijiensis CIRAD86]